MQVPAVEQRGGGLAYKWVIMIVIIFGLFMTVLDSTIVNIAIPRLQNAFGADLNSVQWVITVYTLAQGVATPLTAFFAGRLGTKRFYILSLTAFTIGSFLCGLSWSLPILILFRVMQGLGGAFLFPLSITLLYREFPPNERGLASGILGIPILLAPALGPTLGGYIVTFASWQLIFFVNVPIGIVGVLMAIFLMRDFRQDVRMSFDLPGFLLSAGGLAAVLYALSDASTDGWGSGKVLGLLIGGLLALVLFVIVEIQIANRGGQPLLDLRVFRNASFTAANIASVFVAIGLFGGLFLMPLYLQNLRGLSAFQAGLLLLPQAFASMVGVVLGGRLVDRIGVRAVVIPGLILLTISTWLLTSLSLTTTYGALQWALVLRGLGFGLAFQPLLVAALAEIAPRDLASASSINTVVRFISQSLGIAILATLVQSQTKVHYTHLAEQITTSSPLAQFLTQLQAAFVARGADVVSAHAAAIHLIIQYVQRQSFMLAMQDAFRFTLILVIIGIVATFFVREQRRTPVLAVQEMSSEQREEEERARTEAALAV
jgi:EmrB/QacA subfamily drug resistance transporter